MIKLGSLKQQPYFVALLMSTLLFSACISPLKNFDPYREDEIALLEITAKNIIDLEKAKDYTALYEDYASRAYKKRIPQRKFLKLAHCVERHMGEVLGQDESVLHFERSHEGRQVVENLRLSVQRKNGTVKEQYVLIDDGLGFRINKFRWLSDNKPFAQCISKINSSSKDVEAISEPEKH